MEENKKKAKKLFTSWIVSYLIVCFVSSIYVPYQRVVNGSNPISMLSGYQLFSLAVMVVYFLPLLFTVHHYAALAEMHKLCRFVRVLLCISGIWTILSVIFTIMALLNPALF